MSIQDLGSIGELIAAIATIATLVYLAIQIRHNTSAIKSSVLETTGSRSMELAKFVTQDKELSRIIMLASTSDVDLDEHDRFRLSLLLHATMRGYEVTVAQYSHGYLDSDNYSGLINNLVFWVSLSDFPGWWETAQINYSKELKDAVKEALKNPETYPSVLMERLGTDPISENESST